LRAKLSQDIDGSRTVSGSEFQRAGSE